MINQQVGYVHIPQYSALFSSGSSITVGIATLDSMVQGSLTNAALSQNGEHTLIALNFVMVSTDDFRSVTTFIRLKLFNFLMIISKLG